MENTLAPMQRDLFFIDNDAAGDAKAIFDRLEYMVRDLIDLFYEKIEYPSSLPPLTTPIWPLISLQSRWMG